MATSGEMHPTTAYAHDVVAGRVLAGRLVRLACERHLRDLDEGHRRGIRFDESAASHVIGFVERYLRLAGGEHEGKPFIPQPWQAFILGCLFGWKAADGFRRFRIAYVEAGKGNGKSPLTAAIGLYMLLADGEARAEVYAAATKKDQAMILFRDAVAMVDQSPALAAKLTKSGAKGREWNLAHIKSGSFFRPISSDDGQSGPRPHCGLIDEVHEHKNPLVIDMMRAGTKGRRQALIFEITNSGFDRASVCWRHHEYSVDILTRKRENDSWFAYVCGLDPCEAHRSEGKTQPVDGCPECDDFRDEGTWIKANPNLDVSVTRKYIREQVAEAEGMPSKEGTVRRLNFCWWTEGRTAWLPPDLWARGAGAIETKHLPGMKCYGGLDVATKTDVAAFVLAFPHYPESGIITLVPQFWIPRETAQARQHFDGIPWLAWEREGWVHITDGDVIDLDVIEEAIKKASEDYSLKDVAFDEWNAAQIAAHLQTHGIKMVKFPQNLRNMNEPSKELEGRLKAGTLRHGSHPVLDWMAGNVQVVTDASGNIRPVKPEHNSPRKVDGIVAAVMAIGRAMLDTDNESVPMPEIW